MRIFPLAAAFVALSLSTGVFAQGPQVPDEIHGRYAPGGDCARQPQVRVDRTGVHLETPAGKRGPLPVSVCYSCAGGARYEGIQRWVYVIYGKDRWGGDNMPVTLMFNANEQRGLLEISHDDTLKTPIGAPMTAVVRAKTLKLCRAGGAVASKPSSAVPVSTPGAAKPVAPARTAAEGFASVIGALMQPASVPENSYYDWRFIEKAPHVTWAALPPDMLDKPLPDGNYFRRNGTANVAGRSIKVMAAGARTMIFTHYFKNEAQAIGEDDLLAALRTSGLTIETARCPINKRLAAPRWYRLSGNAKRPAYLWIAAPSGPSQPWEGFSLSLEPRLKPLTPRERTVYTDSCG